MKRKIPVFIETGRCISFGDASPAAVPATNINFYGKQKKCEQAIEDPRGIVRGWARVVGPAMRQVAQGRALAPGHLPGDAELQGGKRRVPAESAGHHLIDRGRAEGR